MSAKLVELSDICRKWTQYESMSEEIGKILNDVERNVDFVVQDQMRETMQAPSSSINDLQVIFHSSWYRLFC